MADQVVYQGVGYVEAQNRVDEYRTGTPAKGAAAALFRAPIKRFAGLGLANTGEEQAHLRLKHQGAVKTQTNEHLAAHAQSATLYTGKLQYKNITPGSVSITNAGAPATIVDDGEGTLVDTGTTTERGTIDYDTGIYSLTFGATPTKPVRASYTHTDWTDFLSATQTTTKAAAAYTFTMNLGYGRVAPGSLAIADGASLTFVDDGKGNIIETTSGQVGNRGTIDYATGLVTITGDGAGTNLAGTVTATYKFNPFGVVLAAGGGTKLDPVFGSIPEMTSTPWAAGIKGESYVGLHGEANVAGGKGTNLVTEWVHYGEEPWRVEALFSGFGAGGFANDPETSGATEHL